MYKDNWAKRSLVLVTICGSLGLSVSAQEGVDEEEKAQRREATATEGEKRVATRAADLLEQQTLAEKDQRVPKTIRENARCIAIFPQVFKAGFLVAAQAGQGLVSCRDAQSNQWLPPAYYDINAASVGLQAGIQSASIILLFLTDESADALRKQRNFTFGGGIDVAAGPVGGTAKLENQPAVVSYARSKGLFAGLDLGGASTAYNREATAKVYGMDMDAFTALSKPREVPDRFRRFFAALEQYAPKPTGEPIASL